MEDKIENTHNLLEENTSKVRSVTVCGLIVNILLTAFKVLIGYIGKSSSVVADGFHSLSDCITDIAVIVGVKYWNKEPDTDHPYGHRRIEAMVSVIIGLSLTLVGIGLISSAFYKLKTNDYQIPNIYTLIVAIASIVCKEILYHWTKKKADILNSSALTANAWHHRSDAFSSIPVALAVGLSIYNPDFALLDPIASGIVSLFILQASYFIAWPSLCELADAGAGEASINRIKEIVLAVEGVKSIHQVRSRFHGNGLYVDLHIQVDANITVREGHEIAGHAKRHLLEEGLEIVDVLVHIEPYE